MHNVKRTLGRLAVYYLLLSADIPFCSELVPETFLSRNLSTIYLFALASCLVLYYSYRLAQPGRLEIMIKLIAWMSLLLILLRGIKYGPFRVIDRLARLTWYFYYVPLLLLPLLFFCVALLTSNRASAYPVRKWYGLAVAAGVLVLLVLTNDWHQQVFRFQPDFADWDGSYSYGWGFYLISVWQYGLYAVAVAVLVAKCRVDSSRRAAWLILIPFVIGISMIVLLATGNMPKVKNNIIEFPEALTFMVAGVLECCMQLGMIPTNQGYRKLFQISSVSAQITDRSGKPFFRSRSADRLFPRQYTPADGERIGEHTVLHQMELPGGFGYWQDDVTELDRLNEDLAEAKDKLAQEAELIQLRNQLKEKQTKIEQQTLVYDTVARRIRRQSQTISRLAKEARQSSDPRVKEEKRRRITLLAAYMKRYANLMLLSEETGVISTGELGLSVAEVLRYLNLCGIPGEILNGKSGFLAAEPALAFFEILEMMLETNLEFLQGVFVNLTGTEIKLTLENLRSPDWEELKEKLALCGIRADVQEEDNVTYLHLILPEGGARQ